MKLVTYARDRSMPAFAGTSLPPRKQGCGILVAGHILDIPSLWPGPNPPRSVKEILQRGPSCLDELAELANGSDILTPLYRQCCDLHSRATQRTYYAE